MKLLHSPSSRPLACKLALSLLSVAVLHGCAIKAPAPLNTQDLLAQDQQDQQAMFAGQEPLAGPLTLEEAIARAVKYNLQQRLALMERAVEDHLVDVQKQGMLPKLTAQAGLRSRSNESASSSQSISTGRQSLESSTSQERNAGSASLQLSWNVLDFGLSYFGAKAQVNKGFAAEERRRRVVADIIRQTRSAYWTAVTAERLKDRLGAVLLETRQALDLSRQAGEKRLVAPLTALRYQRDVLTMVRQLETLDAELSLAKSRLASLMNLPPASALVLAPAKEGDMVAPALPYALDKLEAMAMVQRPELREEVYQARNAVLDTRMALLKLMPNAALFAGANYDSNQFLLNKEWADAGIQVSGNLLNVLAWSDVERSGKDREKLVDLRRQALRMTVLTQVHVAWLERQRAVQLFQRAHEMSRLQEDIQQQIENAARTQSETPLELVRSRVESLLATRARDLAYAELLNAQGTVYQAAGMDPLPDRLADLSVQGLAQSLGSAQVRLETGQLEVPALWTPVTKPVAAPAALPVPGAVAAAVQPVLPAAVSATSAPALALRAASSSANAATTSAPNAVPGATAGLAPVTPALRRVAGMRWEALGSLRTAEGSDALQ